MPRYHFHATHYSSKAQMCLAIAERWLCADGLNDAVGIDDSLAGATDEQLANELIAGWNLDQPKNIRRARQRLATSWMQEMGVSAADFAAAFATLRQQRAEEIARDRGS